MPARVLGLWPDAGLHGTVEIDADILSAAAARVASTVGLVVDARLSLAGPDAGRSADRLAELVQKRAFAALASGFPAAVRGISSTTRSWRGTL